MPEELEKPVVISIQWLIESAEQDFSLPSYETADSSGMDVCAAIDSDVLLLPGSRVLLPTGFAVAIPIGYEIQVRPRSGLAVKHGITIINAPGTIDADYRGEVKIALINLGLKSYTIRRGDRIAQLVVAPVMKAQMKVVEELAPTDRGSGGFGHTGVR